MPFRFEGEKLPGKTPNEKAEKESFFFLTGVERTGSVAKRSREAENPKVTSDWFRYLTQCSRFPSSAKACSLQDEMRSMDQEIEREKGQWPLQKRDRLTGSRMEAPKMPALRGKKKS